MNPGIPPWFRVPVQLIQSEPEEARGWIYLLGQWHIGASPGHNEIRRALGWGAGRVQKFIPKAAKWALANGGAVPEEIAEHFRSSTGAIAEQQRSDTGAAGRAFIEENPAASEQQRSDTGAIAEQQRSDSRARDPFRKKERSEKREEIRSEFRPSAIPEATPQVHLFPSIGLPPAEPSGASSPVQTPPAIPEAPISAPGPVSGASDGEAAATDRLPPDLMAVWAAYRFHHPTCGATPPSGSVRILRRSLKDFTGEQLVAVIHWFHDSDDSTCSFMRGRKLTGLDNIMRIEALPKRVEESGKPWRSEKAGTVLDTDGRIIPPKQASKRADSFDSAIDAYDLAQQLRAQEEVRHGFGG